jgi:hypothetical protein
MNYANILSDAYKQLSKGDSQDLLIRAAARTVLLVAGLHISDSIGYSLETVDILFKRIEESNGITNQDPRS